MGIDPVIATAHPRRRLRLPRCRPRDQAGFTLIELLVSMTMFIVVLIAILLVDQGVYRDSSNDTARGSSLTAAESGVASMVQLLDQAYHVNGPTSGATSNWIDVEVRIPTAGRASSDTRVLFNCAAADAISGYRDCVRYEIPGSCGTGCTPGTPPTGQSGVTVVSRLINGTTTNPVFSDLSTPSGSGSETTFGDVTVDVPSAGQRVGQSIFQHQVVIDNSFYMQNLDFGR